jgi:hypothetical protein
MVGYNVQAAVDAKHHLIIAHEVTNIGDDRSQVSKMAKQAQEATGPFRQPAQCAGPVPASHVWTRSPDHHASFERPPRC